MARGLVRGATDEVGVALSISVDRLIEGDETILSLELSSPSPVEVEVALGLPYGIEVAEGSRRLTTALHPDQVVYHQVTLRGARWGAHQVGVVGLRTRGPDALTYSERVVEHLQQIVKVFPRSETLRSRIRPPVTQAFTGSDVARASGDGIEFAMVRAFAPGDSSRRINWRVSSRRDSLHVNLHHPERNADVVLFLDTFSEVGGQQRTSLDLTVRGAATIAAHYLNHRDRVGVVSFGGTLRWLTGGMGRTQTYRIIDFLLDLEAGFSYVWRDVDVLPRRMVPPGALVVAFSPLEDDRALTALFDLKRRGFSVCVVETLDEDSVEPGTSNEDALAHRLWLLQRSAMRYDMRSAGIPVIALTTAGGLEASLAQVAQMTRRSGVA
jgi:uncharacterized protein (DUF58 family)